MQLLDSTLSTAETRSNFRISISIMFLQVLYFNSKMLTKRNRGFIWNRLIWNKREYLGYQYDPCDFYLFEFTGFFGGKIYIISCFKSPMGIHKEKVRCTLYCQGTVFGTHWLGQPYDLLHYMNSYIFWSTSSIMNCQCLFKFTYNYCEFLLALLLYVFLWCDRWWIKMFKSYILWTACFII